MTAEQWIAATVGEKLEQIAKHPQQLAGSDVVEIGSRKIEKVKSALDIALNESVSSSRGLIVTIPDGDKIGQLKDVLRQFVEAKRASGSNDEQLERIKVWVGPTKKDLMNGPDRGSPCKKVTEFSLLEFLKDNSAESAVKKKSSASADTQTENEVTSVSSRESDTQASEASEAVVPPAAETPLQTPTHKLEDLYSQMLVTPPRDLISSYNTLQIGSEGENSAAE